MKILTHFVSECGQGKSLLDSIFGLQKQFVSRIGNYGHSNDITDAAASLTDALNFKVGIKGTINNEIIFDRPTQKNKKKVSVI